LKAVRLHEHGGAEKLHYEEVDQPELTSPTDVIVEIKAASVNPIDIRTRRGLNGTEVSLPRIPGADAAGIVIETGKEVTNVKRGDKVCLYPASGCGACEYCLAETDYFCTRSKLLGQDLDGTYAGYVKVPARNCFPLPAGLSFEEGAALPLAYTSAWRMLISDAQLKPGEHVLIVGIENGSATAALQVAKQVGAHVVVTSDSDENLELAINWGADHGINHGKTEFSPEVRMLTRKRGVDVVVHCAGGENWTQSFAAGGSARICCGARNDICPVAACKPSMRDLREAR